ncbi:MAG: DJ-1/PfpI family protein [Pseudomonadota bacterium]
MRTLAAVLFDGFETLDMFGPLEFYGMLPEEFEVTTVAETAGHARCSSGQNVAIDRTFADGADYDLVLVPGGSGTRKQVENPAMLDWLRSASADAELVMSVCTGSALLAKAGALDGRRATTNKRAFEWVARFGPKVDWIGRARWVEDGKFFTSSGVSAGMDMTLAAFTHLLSEETALKVATWAEYTWHREAASDPFAVEHGVGGA